LTDVGKGERVNMQRLRGVRRARFVEIVAAAERDSSRSASHAAAGAMLILVVSDVCFYREGLAASLGIDGNSYVACAHAELADVVSGQALDLALVDLGDPGFIETIDFIRTNLPNACIVGLTTSEADAADVALLAASYGVRAFVSRDQSLAELVSAVERAGGGEAVCPSAIASLLFERVAARELFEASDSILTPREREIAALVAQGMTNKEIAAALVIGSATVKNHVHNVLRKLRVHRRTEAAAVLRR
jgi:two-component system nitrate/nitrite response regulator NarL